MRVRAFAARDISCDAQRARSPDGDASWVTGAHASAAACARAWRSPRSSLPGRTRGRGGLGCECDRRSMSSDAPSWECAPRAAGTDRPVSLHACGAARRAHVTGPPVVFCRALPPLPHRSGIPPRRRRRCSAARGCTAAPRRVALRPRPPPRPLRPLISRRRARAVPPRRCTRCGAHSVARPPRGASRARRPTPRRLRRQSSRCKFAAWWPRRKRSASWIRWGARAARWIVRRQRAEVMETAGSVLETRALTRPPRRRRSRALRCSAHRRWVAFRPPPAGDTRAHRPLTRAPADAGRRRPHLPARRARGGEAARPAGEAGHRRDEDWVLRGQGARGGGGGAVARGRRRRR